MGTEITPAHATAVDRRDPDLSLVEISPGYALLYGDRIPEGVELVLHDMMTSRAIQTLSDKLSVGTGASNTAIQAAQGLVEAQGLVRLSPQTLHALHHGQAMTSGGWNLGSIVNNHGNITASVRWAPAAGAQSAALLASLGPAAALLALQVQLASISRRVNENIELTSTVLQELHRDHWATLLSLHETTIRAVQEAHAIGGVNTHVYGAIETKEAELRKMRHIFRGYLTQHLSGMDTDAQAQRQYIHKHSQQMFADIHGVIMAETAWYRSQTLRAGNIMHDEQNLEQNEALLADLVHTTQREHQEALDHIAGLLEKLERQCRLMNELPTSRSLPFTAKRQNMEEAAQMAEALASKVAELRGTLKTQPSTPSPTVTVFNDTDPERALSILRWLLPEEEPLLALAQVTTERWIGDDAYLGITPERCFITSANSLHKHGLIEQEIPLDEVRYVRFTEQDKAGPKLDLITAATNIQLTFTEQAREGETFARARRTSDLLATAMHIPEEEQRADPLLVEARNTQEALQSAGNGHHRGEH